MGRQLPLLLVVGLCLAALGLGLVIGLIAAPRGPVCEDLTAELTTTCREAYRAGRRDVRNEITEEKLAQAERNRAIHAEREAKRVACNICGSTKKFAGVAGRTQARCRKCRSKERHRLLAHYLEHRTPIYTREMSVLHFAANKGLAKTLRALPNLHYRTADLYRSADLRLDLTALDQPDASWDLIIAYHLLEHIEDDRKAMAELFRVLRPGGEVILQVPLWSDLSEIHEDPSVKSAEERTRVFGQKDHVRRYSPGALRVRLEAAGFMVEIVDYLSELDAALIRKHRMRGEFKEPRIQDIWVARKPAP